MPLIKYSDVKFSKSRLDLIEKCNEIIRRYKAMGLVLTLRQLYYQMVVSNAIENTERSYKRLGSAVSDARMAGLVDWEAIEDRGRSLRSNSHWDSPASIIRSARQSFSLDKWRNQEFRPEVWVEKQALESVVASACDPLDVPYFACKGYNSQSQQWAAGMRLAKYVREGQTPIIFHLGDHDPSGMDMTRDNESRLEVFMGGVEVRRLALNMDQIQQYSPPPNPAKSTDSRFGGYRDEYGSDSWELDALDPSILVELIRSSVLSVRDEYEYAKTVELENMHINSIYLVEKNWAAVSRYARELG